MKDEDIIPHFSSKDIVMNIYNPMIQYTHIYLITLLIMMN